MSRIRGRDTAPEAELRRLLWGAGVRYRLQYQTIGGRADLAFPSRRVAVFVDGCFWHGCPEHYVAPRSARVFWSRKLRQNVERDQRQTSRLLDAGWRVLRFWEHEVYESPDRVARAITRSLRGLPVRRGPQPRVVEVDFLDTSGNIERRHLQALRPVRDLGSVVRARSTAKCRRPIRK